MVRIGSAEETVKAAHRRAIAALLVGLAILSATTMYLAYFGGRFTLDDDYVWLYMTGARLKDPAETDRHLDRIISTLEKRRPPNEVLKAQLLRSYMDNYALPSAFYRLGSILTPTRGRDGARYPVHVAISLALGFHIAFGAAYAAVLAGVLACRSWAVIASVSLAIIAMASAEILVSAANQYLVAEDSIVGVALHTLRFAANPSFNFSAFGHTPRSHFTLMLLAVFAARMTGRYSVAYVTILALSFVHQTYAGLLLCMCGLIDAMGRPAVFGRPAVWIPAAASAALFLVRERVWQVVDAPVGLIFLAVVVAVGVLVASAQSEWMGSTIRRWRTQSTPWFTDVLLVMVLWSLTVPVSYVLSRTAGASESLYLWSQLSGRSLGLIRPLMFLACASAIVALVQRRRSLSSLTALVALASILAWSVVSHRPVNPRRATENFASALMSLDGALSAPGASPALSERNIYYAVSKSVDTKTDALAPLVR